MMVRKGVISDKIGVGVRSQGDSNGVAATKRDDSDKTEDP